MRGVHKMLMLMFVLCTTVRSKRETNKITMAHCGMRGLVFLALPTSLSALLGVDLANDPLARRDPFTQLSETELRTRWSSNDDGDATAAAGASSRSLSQRLAALQAVRDATYVDVRLVGFDGDGDHDLRLEEDALQRLLDAAPTDEPQVVLEPRPSEPHELAVRRKFLYRVSAASHGLAEQISRAISDATANATAADTRGGASAAPAAPVPLRAVDELVRNDYLRQRSTHVTLYLLNPRSPRREPTSAERQQADAAAAVADAAQATEGGGSGGASSASSASGALANASSEAAAAVWWQRRRYAYVDVEGGDGAGQEGAGGGRVDGGAAGATTCPLTRWVGGLADGGKVERYLWIDLSAGPVALGPTTAGDGVVTEHTLPSVLNLARRFAGRCACACGGSLSSRPRDRRAAPPSLRAPVPVPVHALTSARAHQGRTTLLARTSTRTSACAHQCTRTPGPYHPPCARQCTRSPARRSSPRMCGQRAR